jgi:hypothetical protein
MPSSGMLCHVTLVTANVSEERISSVIKVTRTGELMSLVTLMMEVIRSSETSVLTRATWHNIPEDGILYDQHIHHCEDLSSHANIAISHEELAYIPKQNFSQ